MKKSSDLRDIPSRNRDESGFFNGIPLLNRAIQSVQVEEGLSARFCLSEDVFSSGSVCEARLLTALLCRPGDAVPVAVLEATILSKGTGLGMGIADACDLLSESLHKVVNDLSRTCVEDLLSVVSTGGVVVLNRLEVRTGFNHLGVSRKFFFALTAHIGRQIKLSLYAIHPFPLQYEYCEPDSESEEYEAFWESFRVDVEKLSNFYCYEFGCKSPSADTGLLINTFSGWQLNVDRFGWTVVLSE